MLTQEKPRTDRFGCVNGQAGSCRPCLVVCEAQEGPSSAHPPSDAIKVGVTPRGEHCLLP